MLFLSSHITGKIASAIIHVLSQPDDIVIAYLMDRQMEQIPATVQSGAKKHQDTTPR